MIVNLEVEVNKLATPSVSFDFKLMQFTFLPHQFDAFETLVKRSGSVDYMGVADVEQFGKFVDTLSKVQKFQDVKAVGTAVNMMVKAALNELEEHGFDDEAAATWVPLASVVGGGAIPADAAEVIKKALDKAEKEGEITKKNRWQLIEYLCASYISGE